MDIYCIHSGCSSLKVVPLPAKLSFIPFVLLVCFRIRFCIGGDTEQNASAQDVPFLKIKSEAQALLLETEKHRPSSSALKPDDVDGWFLLTPLLLTKGILSKGVRALIKQREFIHTVGTILHDIYKRYRAEPQLPEFFIPQEPEEYKSNTLAPSPLNPGL